MSHAADGVSVMLQEPSDERADPESAIGETQLFFIVDDALAYREEFAGHGLTTDGPEFGNGMQLIEVADPDGNIVGFENRMRAT